MPGRYLKRSSELGRLVMPTMAPTSDQRVAGFSFLRRCSSPGVRTLVSTEESVSWAFLGSVPLSPLENKTSPDDDAEDDVAAWVALSSLDSSGSSSDAGLSAAEAAALLCEESSVSDLEGASDL